MPGHTFFTNLSKIITFAVARLVISVDPICPQPRLMPEVLSVCTVQFKSVCDALRTGKKRFMLQGDEINLDAGVGVFILAFSLSLSLYTYIYIYINIYIYIYIY